MQKKIHTIKHTIICMIIILLTVTGCAGREKLIMEIGDQKVYEEEFRLYCDIVRKNMENREDIKLLKEKAAAFAAEFYAKIALAEECGVIDGFSFEEWKAEMTKENEKRAEQSDSGQIVMGLKNYDMEDFFYYTEAGLEAATMEALADNPAGEMLDGAKTYYEANKEKFIENATYTYSVENAAGEIQERTTTYAEIKESVHAWDILGEFLMSGNIGETCTIGEEKFVLKARRITCKDFGKYTYEIVYSYIVDEKYTQLVQEKIKEQKLSFTDAYENDRIIE